MASLRRSYRRCGRYREGKKRRNYETAKSRIRFDWNDVFVRGHGVGTAGEDRLRSRRKLRAIQDLFVGTRQNERSTGCRSHQECRQRCLGSKRLDPGGFGRRCFDRAMEITQNQQTLNTFYDGFGGGWGFRRFGGGGFGEATTTTDTYKVGTVVVDLFDTKTKQLIWRGSSSDTLSNNSNKNIKNLDKGVDKMFKQFPPGSSKK